MNNAPNLRDSIIGNNNGEVVIDPRKPEPIYKNVIDTTSYKNYGPKLNHLNWSQGWCYSSGAFCPNGVAGCAPLAITMACAYFRQDGNIPLYGGYSICAHRYRNGRT